MGASEQTFQIAPGQILLRLEWKEKSRVLSALRVHQTLNIRTQDRYLCEWQATVSSTKRWGCGLQLYG